MSKFLTILNIRLKSNRDSVWVLNAPLVYDSDLIGHVEVPKGFNTDLASVPRVPIIFSLWGGRAHYEGVLHDALFRSDFMPGISFCTANKVFLEAMQIRGKPWLIRWPMYAGVCIGSIGCWHRRKLMDEL